MRYLALVLGLGVVGCYQPHPAGEASCTVTCGPSGECPTGMICNAAKLCVRPGTGDCTAMIDAPTAGGNDGGTGSDGGSGSGSGGDACYGAHLRVCFTSAPPMPLTLSTDVNTTPGADARCTMPSSVTPALDACFIAADTITVQGTVRVTGSRPLVLVAVQSITVDGGSNGVLDLTGDHSSKAAGAEIGCSTSGINGSDGTPASGGAGGSYVTRGGTGGAGGNHNGGNAANTVNASVAAFRGGCAGGNGGDANQGATKGGPGGGGGGAVYLIAGSTITISGMINASGEGGRGGDKGGQFNQMQFPGAGGGGGGAGGAIGLEAPTVNASGAVIANGGGGGAGGDDQNNGADGKTPDGAATDPASGGSGTNGAGNGGAGFGTTGGNPVQAASASSGGSQNSGGGGGGGGGAILVYATSPNLSGRISPKQTSP